MAVFISHVAPLWSFAAARAPEPGVGRRTVCDVSARGPAVWLWVRGEDGRPERRWARPAAE
ncbi:MAG: hypothetical protein P4L73_10140 [Caulobacteraceae bacterium]|nr:hypothetical protein [Caulobacteraceae bacterium]